ncbi:MAG: orotidine-5'-phosphate decarboxylase [bacterium]|nr:orotidine-5'-phosphate decarboxylase [bacterium]
MENHFADRLTRRQRQLGHPLCVGLDPHLDRVPPLFRRGSMTPEDPRTADAVEAFLLAILDRVAPHVAVIKPQIAFFERLGWRGLRVLERLVEQARSRNTLVLLDAKRGDIGSTAAGYAAAYLGPGAAIRCDAMTLNPYLGRDSLVPFLERSRRGGEGLFVLVKTSNPGSGDFQDRRLDGGGSLSGAVAEALAGEARELRGPATGWSSLGVVVGATYPGESEKVRELLPYSLFLVPGYGAQGGSAKAALRGFVPGPDGRLEGGLVSSSRGILYPPGSDTDDATRWEQAVSEALERSIDELRTACV